MNSLCYPSRRLRLSLYLLLLSLLSQAVAGNDIGHEPSDVNFQWAVKIPMRDGVRLNATLYRPLDWQDKKLPAIVTITPYISDRYHPDAQYFARHGYAFVVVDTRGRGNSEGEFRPLDLEDGRDGHDVVQWIAAQAWSNGKVAMRGGSYGGYNQWVTARHFPANLSTIVPIASPYHGVDFPMNYNIQYPYIIRWLTLTAGNAAQGRIFGDDAFWNRKYLQYHTSGMAFAGLDQLVGHPNATFQRWISHPQLDDYWAERVPSSQQLEQLSLPILTITGYYDGDQPGAMQYYREHMRHGNAQAKADHYLLLGPWDHSGTRMPRQEFGGIRFGDAMMFDAFGLDHAWYQWTMADGERPEMLKDRVTYFVAGANVWKSAPSLQAVADSELSLRLGSQHAQHNVFVSGSLSSSHQPGLEQSHYVYDPLDTSKAERGDAEAYLTDQSEVIHTAGDGLIFHSEPFAEATEISGYLKLEAWLEMDVPDTDINVTVYEIKADGSSIALAGETQRARYRESLTAPQLVEPGSINRYTFERFYWFSRQLEAGSRLRLFIRPANGLQQQRHYNAGKPVHLQSKDDARTATIRLHHSERYPSRLILPLVSQ
ncbi:MAG: CocE/NonD family hydrolase [Gammaproteobacteria bacterium]|nr:CocE/NonD family hydrolase [Gammaproteobacteria bacterium]